MTDTETGTSVPKMSTHKIISFIKSVIRIFGYVAGLVAFQDNRIAVFSFWVLVVSEIIGVIEEIGEN